MFSRPTRRELIEQVNFLEAMLEFTGTFAMMSMEHHPVLHLILVKLLPATLVENGLTLPADTDDATINQVLNIIRHYSATEEMEQGELIVDRREDAVVIWLR